MALTTATAKPVFNIGSFNVDTGLDIPAITLSNKITFEFSELVSEATPSPSFDPSGTTGNIFVLFSIDYNGTQIYENAQFSAVSGAGLTDPDITIAVSGWGTTPVEAVTINNPIQMVTGLDAQPSSGNYSISLRYFWQYDAGGEWAVNQVDYPTVSYSYTPQTPTLGNWYDTGIPELRLMDETVYQFNGTTPSRESEFILYPPQNKATITTETTDIQEVTYSSFWTGGNEFQYTILVTYDLSDKKIVNVQQKYKDFTIYNISRCDIFNCLNNLYERYVAAPCGTKQKIVTQENLIEANNLALQILSGSGCGEDEYSEILAEFNALCDSSCGCGTGEPVQINAANVVAQTEIQSVTATTATTEIDLSAGSTVTITVSADTTLDISNIEQYSNYRFIFIADSGNEVVSFPSADFEDDNGDMADITLNQGGILILDFYAQVTNKLTLVSRSDADDYDRNVQDITSSTASTNVDLSLGNIASIALTNTTTEMGVTNIVEDEEYTFIFSRSFASQTATFSADFNGPDGTVEPVTPLLDDRVILKFRATSPTELTLMSRSDAGGDEYTAGTGIDITNNEISANAATQASLLLADTSTQPGDNVSTLTNDAGYLTSAIQTGDNVSLLTNDAGYLTGLTLPVFNDSFGAPSSYSVDFSGNDQMFTFDMDSSNLTITTAASNEIVDGKVYVFLIKATGAARDVTFASTAFRDQSLGVSGITRTIADGDSAAFTFIGTEELINTSFCMLISEIS